MILIHVIFRYVNIDQAQGIELFYYFFESENKPTEEPLLVWFTGGPGCSGASAILFENGLYIDRHTVLYYYRLE